MMFRGVNLVLPESVALRLVRALPKRGIALWEFERQVERRGGVAVIPVRLPVSRRWVRVYRIGDQRAVIVPQGDLVTVWRVLLDKGKGVGDLFKLVRSTPFAKRVRQLEVDGTYGPGGSLPLAFYLPEDEDYPRFGKRTPAGAYVRAMKRAFGMTPMVAEVGVTLDAAVRIARRCGVDVSDPKRAAAAVAMAARRGDLLLVLRRMPLTDPLTGFVIALPVVMDVSVSDASGEMVWLPPDVAVLLYGDEDGDRYYVDLASAVKTDQWLGAVDDKALKLLIRETRAFWVGGVAAPAFLTEPPVKMAGLYGAAALAGILSVQGVGPLFSVVYRVAGALERAGFRKEAALVSSYLMRVFEPLFDARKRLVEGKIVGEDPVTGESVVGYSLPYASAIIRSVRSSTVGQVRDIMAQLASDLLADADEDAQATGALVQKAVSVLDGVLEHGDIVFGLNASGDVVVKELRDIDLFAATAGHAPLDGSLTKSVARPVLGDARGERRVADGWTGLDERELRHVVGGESFVGLELPLPLAEAADAVDDVYWLDAVYGSSSSSARSQRREERVVPFAVQRALDFVAEDLPVLVLLDLSQRAPFNKQDRERFEQGGYVVIRTESELRSFAGDSAIVDRFNRFVPVFWHAQEKVRVYAQPPVKVVDGVVVVDEQHPSRLSPAEAVHDRRAFKIGLGWTEIEGVKLYRWHLLMLGAHKTEGYTWDGRHYVGHRYAVFSVYATPWFIAEPGAFVSGCPVLNGLGDREEWLPGRFDAVLTGVGESLRVESLYLTPQVVLLASLLAGVLWNQLGVLGEPTKSMAPAVRAVLRGESDPGGYVYGADEAVRVQRAVRQTVRRAASQALVLRHEFSYMTAPHVTVFGDLIRAGLGYAGIGPDQDVAMHRFNKLVTAVVKRLYGADAIWYPRKGGQNRIIGLDLADAEHWQNLLALGGQEWYRFVRETPGLMSVEASVHGCRGVVHPMVVALVDAPGLIQPEDGKSSSETAYLFRHAVDYVEQERSQLVELVEGVDVDRLLRERLTELKRHGFEYLRSSDGGVVAIDDVLAQQPIDFQALGVAHRYYEASITGDAVQVSMQYWAVSRSCPVGAKVVVLDGMIKSFATVVTDTVTLADGTPVDAMFSAISARKKQAWGLLLNGAARMAGIDPEPIWVEYRRVLAQKRAELGFDVTVAGKVETEAMQAAFAKARELGVELKPVELYVERDGKRQLLGEAFVGIVYLVFIDDTSVRDDDPDEAGFNGTVLFSANQIGVPYQRRFVKTARALELSQATWYALSQMEKRIQLDLDAPVVKLGDMVDDDGGGDDGGGDDAGGVEVRLELDEPELDGEELVDGSQAVPDEDGDDTSVEQLPADAQVVDLSQLGTSLAVEDGMPELPSVELPADAQVVDLSQLGASLGVDAGALDLEGVELSAVELPADVPVVDLSQLGASLAQDTEGEGVTLVELEGDLWQVSAERGLPAVVPVNCAGAMGAGVAEQAAERYPGLLEEYRKHLAELSDGRSVYLEQFQVVLFPTKYHWKLDADLELIAAAARSMPVRAAVMPRVGAGLGRLDWSEVKRVLVENLPAGEWIVVVPPTSPSAPELSESVQSEPVQSESVRQRIDSFRGTPLSNFYSVRVVWKGVEYPSVENAYQAAKLDYVQTVHERLIDDTRLKLRRCSAAEAKRTLDEMFRNRAARLDETAWKRDRVSIMRELLKQKFSRSDLADYLLSTGDAELVEGNNWGDTFWGVCTGCSKWWCQHGGENMLGRLLMEIREMIANGEPLDGGMPDDGGAHLLRWVREAEQAQRAQQESEQSDTVQPAQSDVPAPMCMIIGTAEPTPEQIAACRAAAQAAARRGLVVLSGGAEGIDTIAVTAAAEAGGQTVTIQPWQRPHNLPGVVEVQPPVDQQTQRIVLENHPNPSALKESHIKLHARNVRMVQRLLSVIDARRAAGADVKDCIIIALPGFYRGEPTGGTMMGMRLAKSFNIPCRYYVPGEGWKWWHRP